MFIVPKKSFSDQREYRIFSLPNGLQCICVSDPTAERAAAALDVGVGQFSDPAHAPGLAHFLEHMLFMGTEKYPNENEYSEFLNKHGGSSNAWTANENTNYHFDILCEHFEGGLDRFAQFFIAPLFQSSSVEREMQAVENEHCKNLPSDAWRSNQLLKATAKQQHNFNRFGSGNLHTLYEYPLTIQPGKHIRQTLIEFYKEKYSANIMKLAVLSNHSLDQLQKWVETYFSAIPNSNKQREPIPSEFFDPKENLNRMFIWPPLRDYRQVTFLFPIPMTLLSPQSSHIYKQRLTSFFSHVLGHEGSGSLLSYLKNEGLANSLSAGLMDSYSSAAIFSVSIEMTEKALPMNAFVDKLSGKKVESSSSITDEQEIQEGGHFVYKIAEALFAYIHLLLPPDNQQTNSKFSSLEVYQEEMNRIYKENANVASLKFRYRNKEEPENYVVDLAHNLHSYKPEDVVAGPHLYGAGYDEDDDDDLKDRKTSIEIDQEKEKARKSIIENSAQKEIDFGLFRQLLSYFTPSNMRIHLMARQLTEVAEAQAPPKVEYRVIKDLKFPSSVSSSSLTEQLNSFVNPEVQEQIKKKYELKTMKQAPSSSWKDNEWQREPFYQTPFYILPFSSSLIKRLEMALRDPVSLFSKFQSSQKQEVKEEEDQETILAALRLPKPNPFIPTNFELFHESLSEEDQKRYQFPVMLKGKQGEEGKDDVEIETISLPLLAPSSSLFTSCFPIDKSGAENKTPVFNSALSELLFRKEVQSLLKGSSLVSPSTSALLQPIQSSSPSSPLILYLPDQLYHRPKAYVLLNLTTPHIYSSSLQWASTQIWMLMLDDVLNEFSYEAECAGLYFSLSSDVFGLTLTVSGCNEKLHLLLFAVVEKMKSFLSSQESKEEGKDQEQLRKKQEQRFFIYREQLRRRTRSDKLSPAYSQATSSIQHMLRTRFFSIAEKEQALEEVTFNDLLRQHQQIFEADFGFSSFMFVSGNFQKKESYKMGQKLTAILSAKLPSPSAVSSPYYLQLPALLVPTDRFVHLSSSSTYVKQQVNSNKEDQNNCCIFLFPLFHEAQDLMKEKEKEEKALSNVYIDYKGETIKEHVISSTKEEIQMNTDFLPSLIASTSSIVSYILLDLLTQIINEHCFDCLRTKQTLGYLVWSGEMTVCGVSCLRLIVQSGELPADLLRDRMNQYIYDEVPSMLEDMNDESFQKHKQSLLAEITEKDKTLQQTTQRFWSEMQSGDFLFNRMDLEVQFLNSLSKQHVLDFYRFFLSQDTNSENSRRRQFIVEVYSNKYRLPPKGTKTIVAQQRQEQLIKEWKEQATSNPTESIESEQGVEKNLKFKPAPEMKGRVLYLFDEDVATFKRNHPLLPSLL